MDDILTTFVLTSRQFAQLLLTDAAPKRKLHVIANAVGASIGRLSQGRKHWSEWVSGDREPIMDL